MQAEHKAIRQGKPRWLGVLAALVLVALSGALLLPWGASAYFVERAGRRLAAEELSQATAEAAVRYLRQALSWDSGNAQAYRLLATLYAWQGPWLSAAEAWTEFIELRPDDPQSYWELAALCEALDTSDLGEATRWICGSDAESRDLALVGLWRAAGQTAASFVQAGDRSYKAKDWAQATAFYQRALLMDPDTDGAWLGLGKVHFARKEMGQAQEALARVLDLSVEPAVLASAHDYRGQILARAKRWEEASAELALALALAPDNGAYHLRYGWYAIQAGGSLEESRVHLEQARELRPRDPWPELRLADVAFFGGDYEAMLARAQQALQKDSSQVWGWILQGRALRYLGQLDAAEQSLRRALELAPEQPAAHNELGEILMQGGHPGEAIGEYKQAVALASRDERYYLSLGRAYVSVGQIAEAVAIYQQILEFEPDNPDAIRALQELGD
jgi:tetratricopeptide (TPR) repeat protein